jgi:hypothetical protein
MLPLSIAAATAAAASASTALLPLLPLPLLSPRRLGCSLLRPLLPRRCLCLWTPPS